MANKERLLRLATFLDALPKERFNFRTWVGGDWKGMPDLSCGTTACALGWAATLPDMGLTLDPPDSNFDGATFMNDGREPLYAACDAFDISLSDAERLFVPQEQMEPSGTDELSVEEFDEFMGRYQPEKASARDLANHIRRFVEALPQ